MRLRLDKFLANKAFGSRKEVHHLIKQGLVMVDGVVASKKDMSIQIPEQTITVNGELVDSRQTYYVKLNKPAGYVCAVEDARHPTVMELLPPDFLTMGVVPVGRLDKDTEGLLLLSNDGVWAHKIINGKKHIPKTYYIEYAGELSEEGIGRITEGILLGDGTQCKPASLEIIEPGKAHIVIEEGKYHQVKRMIGAAGGEVTYLKRLTVGPITLKGLENLGDFTDISAEDMEKL